MKYPRTTIIIRDKKGKKVHTYHTGRNRSVLFRVDGHYQRGFSVFVRVDYSKQYHNEGEYFTKKDFIYAYKCFMDKDLIEEFKRYISQNHQKPKLILDNVGK